MDFLLMSIFGFFTLVFSFSILFLFKQNPIMKSLFLFMLLVSIWQFHIAVLFVDNNLPKKMIELLFRLFGIGPSLVPPTFLYVFYSVVKRLEEQIENKWWKYIFNKKVLVSYYGLSIVYYGFHWSYLFVKKIHFVKDSPIMNFWYPIFGEMVFLNLINLSLFFILIVITIFVIREIRDKNYHFLKEFIIFATILDIIGGLDYSRSYALLLSVLGMTTFSIGMFIIIIRHQLKMIEDMKKTLENSYKMEVIGQMAAGVAHEIRNPLTSIRGFIQLLESQNSDKSKYFDIILSELD